MSSCDAYGGAVVGLEPEFGMTSEIPWVTSPRILVQVQLLHPHKHHRIASSTIYKVINDTMSVRFLLKMMKKIQIIMMNFYKLTKIAIWLIDFLKMCCFPFKRCLLSRNFKIIYQNKRQISIKTLCRFRHV